MSAEEDRRLAQAGGDVDEAARKASAGLVANGAAFNG
jgi:hypothetical protein